MPEINLFQESIVTVIKDIAIPIVLALIVIPIAVKKLRG